MFTTLAEWPSATNHPHMSTTPNKSSAGEANTASQSLLNDYIFSSDEKPLQKVILFLIECNVSDTMIVKAVQCRSVNFGMPELLAFKTRIA